jgi:hypothetical protein
LPSTGQFHISHEIDTCTMFASNIIMLYIHAYIIPQFSFQIAAATERQTTTRIRRESDPQCMHVDNVVQS